MSESITSFREEHFFLSNFYPCVIELDEDHYATLEHALQASKTTIHSERYKIMGLPTPGKAKRAGQEVPLRKDWEQVKLKIMADLLWQKFSQPELTAKLLATGDAQLIEGNDWGDRYWGQVNGVGHNHLGRLLMAVRALLRETVPGG
jgi:N-glycosidase YbiA